MLGPKICKMCDLFVQTLEHNLVKIIQAILGAVNCTHVQGETSVPLRSVCSRPNKQRNPTGLIIMSNLFHIICEELWNRFTALSSNAL